MINLLEDVTQDRHAGGVVKIGSVLDKPEWYVKREMLEFQMRAALYDKQGPVREVLEVGKMLDSESAKSAFGSRPPAAYPPSLDRFRLARNSVHSVAIPPAISSES